jgi:protein-tyrosine-phosphatase
MKSTLELLKGITEEEIGLRQSDASEYILRKEARAIALDPKERIVLVYSSRDKSYEVPGGGLEEGENPEEALKREMLEEIGYDIKIDCGVGITIQYRNTSKLLKIAYCFLVHTVGKPKKPKLDKYEIAAGLRAVWTENIDNALKLMNKNPNEGPGERFSNSSDIAFLKKGKKHFKERKIKMKILFVCKSNAERSQVAQAFFNSRSKKNRAYSAGLALMDSEKGFPPGRIVTELMLGAGFDGFRSQRRKQLTEAMARKADIIIVIMGKKEAKEYVPEYLKRMRVSYWHVGGLKMPKGIFTNWPPPTYKYHVMWVFEIDKKVKELVRKIG